MSFGVVLNLGEFLYWGFGRLYYGTGALSQDPQKGVKPKLHLSVFIIGISFWEQQHWPIVAMMQV